VVNGRGPRSCLRRSPGELEHGHHQVAPAGKETLARQLALPAGRKGGRTEGRAGRGEGVGARDGWMDGWMEGGREGGREEGSGGGHLIKGLKMTQNEL
jgi:hypothetical protein